MGFGAWVIAEIGGGDLEDIGEEAGSFEVHAVGGEQGGEFSEGVLDGRAGEAGGDLEGLVFDDGWDVVGAVGVAHEVVVHGSGAASAAVLVVVVHALVRDGWFSAEVGVVVGHGLCAPPGWVISGFVDVVGVGGGESYCG